MRQLARTTSFLPYFVAPVLLCCFIAMKQSYLFDHKLKNFFQEPSIQHDTLNNSKKGANSTNVQSPLSSSDPSEQKNGKFHTGSFANCTTPINEETTIDGPDSGTVIVSCKKIPFRAKLESFHSNINVITGVLSSAGGKGPERRQSIRKTWASDRNAVFFLVGGPWKEIEQEYQKHSDLIWIDEEEVYDGERSVLTLKTYSFFAIAYAAEEKYNYTYTHLFKTDDDSYVSLDALYDELRAKDFGFTKQRKNTHDYFGQCQLKYPMVHREEEYKWPIRKTTYPEPWFPRYCQGSGFGISKDFLSCAVSQHHIANVRFMPFEDVAVGMLAERCGFMTEWPFTAKVKVFRYFSDEMKKRVRLGSKKTDDVVAPAACMTNKIVQHRIIDEFDMEEHHKSVLDPSYCNVTKATRNQRIKELNDKGIEWFG